MELTPISPPLQDFVPVIFSSRTTIDNKCVISPASLQHSTAGTGNIRTNSAGLAGNRQFLYRASHLKIFILATPAAGESY
jgi:hypothetical protein